MHLVFINWGTGGEMSSAVLATALAAIVVMYRLELTPKSHELMLSIMFFLTPSSTLM
jgi:hypothetical protein